MQTQHIILLLCFIGFCKEFRPSEAFISPFLRTDKNLTTAEINKDVYPIGTYSNMSLLIVVFLLTDYLRYKPVLIIGGISGIITWSALAWSYDLVVIQMSQITYGLFCACDVAYSSYMYAKIDKKYYQKATGQTKASTLIAKAGSGVISQVLIMYRLMTYQQLNYITLAALISTTLLACALPPVPYSSFFNRPVSPQELEQSTKLNNISSEKQRNENDIEDAAAEIVTDEPEAYSLRKMYHLWITAMKDKHTLKWSVWLALSLCGYLQVSYYIQLLWQAVIDSSTTDTSIYHGFSNGFNSLLGALCSYCVGYIHADWTKYGEIVLALCAVAQGLLLIYASVSDCSLVFHYIIYAAYKIFYQASNTIAMSEVAKTLQNDSYGLIFGVNQFLALVEQSIATIFITKVFHMEINTQFSWYGGYFLSLGLVFAVMGVITIRNEHLRRRIEVKDVI